MSFMYFNKMENQARATRIARQMLKGLAVSDIECMITDSMAFDHEDYDKLCAAIDSDFPAIKKRDQHFIESAFNFRHNLDKTEGHWSDRPYLEGLNRMPVTLRKNFGPRCRTNIRMFGESLIAI
jgi:hypothetical protein